MKINKLVLASLAAMLGWSGTAFAQTEVDALRYTRLGVAGSARIQGIGGAQTALGADISTMTANPAGLGMFRRSEFSVTPGYQSINSQAVVNGNAMSDSRGMITIPQAGFVLSNRKGDADASDWRGATFGINLSRINNFNQNISYGTTSVPPNTIVDYFAEQAIIYGRTEADLEDERGNFSTLEGLAYGNYLIDFWDAERGEETESIMPLYSLGDIDQQEEIQRHGSQNQFDIGFGTSYKDKLYLGASIGVVTSNFTQKSTFRESGYYVDEFNENDEPILAGNYNLELYDEFTSRGTGVNLRLGVIARPVDALRLGVSVQTPTAYTFTDQYHTSLNSTSLNPETGLPENYSSSIAPGQFTYRLTTPLRANGGVAFFLNKYGFITADIEYVDYSNIRFSEDNNGYASSGDFFSNLNSSISDTYRSVVNYKIGAEGRYDVFRFRAGYGVSSDPYRNAAFDGKVNSVSLGAGVRLQNYYADLAYVNSTGNTRYSPYTFIDSGEPVVNIEDTQTAVMLTIGYNF